MLKVEVRAGGIHNVGPDGPNTTIGQLIDNCVRATSSDATRCEWTSISCSPKEFSCQSVAFAGPSGDPLDVMSRPMNVFIEGREFSATTPIQERASH